MTARTAERAGAASMSGQLAAFVVQAPMAICLTNAELDGLRPYSTEE